MQTLRILQFGGRIAPAALAILLAACGSQNDPQPDEAEHLGTQAEQLIFASPRFPISELPVEVVNVNSGKCLDVFNGSKTAGTQLQQYHCTGGKNQAFFFSVTGLSSYQIRAGDAGNMVVNVPNGSMTDGTRLEINNTIADSEIFGLVSQSDGSYEIASKKSSKCLDVENGATTDGAFVQQLGCTGASKQRWRLNYRPIAMNLIAKHSSRCADVTGASTADSQPVQQYDCARSDNQGWSLGTATTVFGNTYYPVIAKHSGKCLDVANASLSDGAPVNQYHCTGGNNQLWSINEDANGFVTLTNKLSGKCLDVPGADVSNGRVLQQYTCTGGDNQKWWYAPYFARHLQIVQAGLTENDNAILAQVGVLNDIYGKYGIRLSYNQSTDKVVDTSQALQKLLIDDTTLYSCSTPPGSMANSFGCAARVAAQWPDKVVAIGRSGNSGFSSGDLNYLVVGPLNIGPIAGSWGVPDVRFVSHEFGHYMGVNHTAPEDFLSDTHPDPSADPCLAPNTPTGIFNGAVVDTNNVMSYYYNNNPLITHQQASIVRSASYLRTF